MSNKMTIALLKKEAELYRSHGLYQEAIAVYDKMLDVASGMHPATRDSIQAKIRRLNREIEEMETDVRQVISPRDLMLVRKGWSKSETGQEVLQSARAFKELGLFKEAISEYVKLFQKKVHEKELLAEISDCMRVAKSDRAAVELIDFILEEKNAIELKNIDFACSFALALEKKGLFNPALYLFHTIKKIDPRFPDIDSKIKTAQNLLAAAAQKQKAEAEAIQRAKITPHPEKVSLLKGLIAAFRSIFSKSQS